MSKSEVIELIPWAILGAIVLGVFVFVCRNSPGPTGPPVEPKPKCCLCGNDLIPMKADEIDRNGVFTTPALATHYCNNHPYSGIHFFVVRKPSAYDDPDVNFY